MRYCSQVVAATRVLTGVVAFSLFTSLPSVAAEPADLVADICDLAAPAPCTPALINAVRTYIYGYPLLMVDVTKDVATNVVNATTTTGRAPINQFSNNGLPDQTYQDIVLPSVSTPYSNAFLDLGKEPLVLHIPDVGQLCQPNGGPPCAPRFWLMQMIDGWTNVGGLPASCITSTTTPPPEFCGIGSRYYSVPGDYALAGPDYDGPFPAGITQVIRFETNIGWIAGRLLTNGSTADLASVTKIQQQLSLVPLRRYGRPYTPPTNRVNPRINMTDIPRTQVADMDAWTYFKKLANLMGPNPPAPEDAAIVAAMAKIGLVPGEPFKWNQLDRATKQALELANVIGQFIIAKASKNLQYTTTNWSMALDLGSWGTKYLERAATAYGGLGANLYLDAVYAGGIKDTQGNQLSGDNNYTLTFGTGQYPYPPTNPNAFWSVTLYQLPSAASGLPSETLYNNEINRYGLGIPAVQGHSVCPNDDGSLTLYIQNQAPGDPTSKEYCNWLPAPPTGSDGQTKFLLLLRMYWPDGSLFTGTWEPPPIVKMTP